MVALVIRSDKVWIDEDFWIEVFNGKSSRVDNFELFVPSIYIVIFWKVSRADYKTDEDPTKYKSEKTGRGPLSGNWKTNVRQTLAILII